MISLPLAPRHMQPELRPLERGEFPGEGCFATPGAEEGDEEEEREGEEEGGEGEGKDGEGVGRGGGGGGRRGGRRWERGG